MADIYFPVSTTTLANSPLVDITIDNESTLNVITLDSRGFVGKTPLGIFKTFLKPSSLGELSDIINPNVLLGRYSSGTGPIEEITLGEGLSVTNGILNCDLGLVGDAGGDLEGTYPNPTIKDGVITLSKFSGLSNNKLLGRYSPGTGQIEEISLSNDFEISNGQLNLLNTNNVSLTGFIISTQAGDFTALPTNLYYVNSNNNINITVNTGDIGDQIIIINKGTGIITIYFPNETLVMNPLNKKIGFFVRDDLDNFYDLHFTTS